MEHDFEWFLQNEKAYDSLTAEQVELLGQGGTLPYDPAEPAAVVEPEPVVVEPAAVAAVTEPVDPTVLTADGKNTIPYSEFRAFKDRTQAAEASLAESSARIAEQAELIESLKAARVADVGTGDTTAQDEVLANFKTDYPELAETFMPALDKMLAAKDSAFAARLAEVEAKLAPIQQSTQNTAVNEHLATIVKGVPDFNALLDSGAVDEWVAKLPGYARVGAERVLNEGTASEVVELFTQYKATLAAPAPVTAGVGTAEAKAAAAAAIANAKTKTPLSASDIPAHSTATGNEDPTTVTGWSAKYAKMSPEDILRSL
jgi:hypothetical protein